MPIEKPINPSVPAILRNLSATGVPCFGQCLNLGRDSIQGFEKMLPLQGFPWHSLAGCMQIAQSSCAHEKPVGEAEVRCTWSQPSPGSDGSSLPCTSSDGCRSVLFRTLQIEHPKQDPAICALTRRSVQEKSRRKNFDQRIGVRIHWGKTIALTGRTNGWDLRKDRRALVISQPAVRRGGGETSATLE